MSKKIMFEVVPPMRKASPSYFEKVINGIIEIIDGMDSVKILNIPEIVDENYCGMPYYRNIDNREFGKLLREKCHKEILINKVVVHFNPKDHFNEWLDETINDFGIRHLVLVGGTFPVKYPGPTVLEANKLASGKNISLGNIVIPTRQNESDNLIRKTQSGCSFFTSQVLFEPETTIKMVKDYSLKCKELKLKPSTIFLSFSPLSDSADIDFLKWLGAYMDEATEKRLRKSTDMGKESLDICTESYLKIAHICKECKVPCKPNIEQITFHNLDLSRKMVEIFSDL